MTVQAKILRLLAELQQLEHLAVLLITHNLAVVAEIADDVLVMYAGRIVEAGPVHILGNPRHPYVNGLLKALPQLGTGPARLEGIAGTVPPLGRRPPGCRFHPRCPLAQPVCQREPPLNGPGDGHRAACWVRRQRARHERPLLMVENLRVTYPAGRRHVTAVRGATFTIERGRCLGCGRQSGSGKSSLARGPRPGDPCGRPGGVRRPEVLNRIGPGGCAFAAARKWCFRIRWAR